MENRYLLDEFYNTYYRLSDLPTEVTEKAYKQDIQEIEGVEYMRSEAFHMILYKLREVAKTSKRTTPKNQ